MEAQSKAGTASSTGRETDVEMPASPRRRESRDAVAAGGQDNFPNIVYGSKSQVRFLEKLKRVAETDAEILITGPTGVGKELYARHAHACSRRSDRSFVAVNCSNLSSELLENEIFGHARGAYTGAQGVGIGIVATADGGTLFFDEIDTLTSACQAKLLRFIQSKEYRRVGETIVRRVNVRFIAASNADLAALVREGKFREDLFFRLRVVPIEVLPLADRIDDLRPLLDHFVTRYATEYELSPIAISEETMEVLHGYAWPGNVREVENCVRYLTCMQFDRTVTPEDLPLPIAPSDGANCHSGFTSSNGATRDADSGITVSGDHIFDLPLQEAKARLISEFETLYLNRALERSGGNVSAAARTSGKHRRAFFELMRKYGLDKSVYRTSD